MPVPIRQLGTSLNSIKHSLNTRSATDETPASKTSANSKNAAAPTAPVPHASSGSKTYSAPHFSIAQKHYPIVQSLSQAADSSSSDDSATNKVRNSSEQFNGKCTWSFSQDAPEIKKILQREKKSSNGICEMLSAVWVERKVNGSSLEHYLKDPSGKIDLDKIRQIQQLHIAGTTLNPGAMIEDKNSLGYISERAALQEMQSYLASDKSAFFNFFTPAQQKSIRLTIYASQKNRNAAVEQALDNIAGRLSDSQRNILEKQLNKKLTQPKQAQATEKWLQAKNIETINKLNHKKDINQTDFYQQMADAIINKTLPNQSDDCYQLIAIRNHGQACWGHKTAMLINQEKIDFFDPNVGEFHFDKKADFAAWWPVFLDLADYSSGQNRAPCNAYQIIFCVPQQ